MSASEKKDLRHELLSVLAELPESYITRSDHSAALRLLFLPEFLAARTIFTYLSRGREPETRMIINTALALGKTVTLPKTYGGGVMAAVEIRSLLHLTPSRMGLLEPSDGTQLPPDALDFIVVPAVTYDTDGYRLGYGGGYYDRYLPDTRAFTAGLARERLLLPAVPREPHDVAVRCLVTETTVRRFA